MNPRIVIVGAGAAGVAAGRWLRAAGCETLLIEARSRVGGRAWTDTAAFGFPVDMGCAWLHSADRNPWMSYAREQGFSVIERLPDWRSRIGADEPTQQYRAEWAQAWERNEQLIVTAAARGLDVSVAELIPNDRHKPTFDAIMTWLMGADSEHVSSIDFARYGHTGIDWAVAEGLGSVIAHAAAPLDARLNTPVREIDARGRLVRIVTDPGVIEADAVIVTVPTNVLATDAIGFKPALPVGLSEAFRGVPLGVANKVFFQMTPGSLPYGDTVHFVGTDTTARTASYVTRPAGKEVLLAYFGGSLAAGLERAGELESFARAELAGIFGTEFPSRIVRSVSTGWSTDPWSLGSYSVALPGRAHLRERLSEPVHDRVFFAGEACSIEHFGTVHGAWHSAVDAARRALATLSGS